MPHLSPAHHETSKHNSPNEAKVKEKQNETVPDSNSNLAKSMTHHNQTKELTTWFLINQPALNLEHPPINLNLHVGFMTLHDYRMVDHVFEKFTIQMESQTQKSTNAELFRLWEIISLQWVILRSRLAYPSIGLPFLPSNCRSQKIFRGPKPSLILEE
jgi:hypothetical protein